MKVNIGSADRLIRLILGIALLAWAVFGGLAGPWFWLALIAGLVAVVTGVLRACPAYALFGMSTCSRK